MIKVLDLPCDDQSEFGHGNAVMALVAVVCEKNHRMGGFAVNLPSVLKDYGKIVVKGKYSYQYPDMGLAVPFRCMSDEDITLSDRQMAAIQAGDYQQVFAKQDDDDGQAAA